MRIESVEVFPLYLSPADVQDAYATSSAAAIHDHGYVIKPPWRSLYSDGTESLLVRIAADDGTVGWGEALAPVAPQVAATIIETLMTPFLLGADPREHLPLRHRLAESMRERGHLTGHQADALAAVDIALWDLRGKASGQSIASMLGGAFSAPVPAYVSGLRGSEAAELGDRARELQDGGGRLLKLHLGAGVEHDLAIVDAVQNAAPLLRVAVDAHWSYDLGDARRLGGGLDERAAWFFEAPLAPEDVMGHRDLAAALATPIAIGEAMRNRFEFRDWLGMRAVGIVQPDVGRTGITELMAIGTLADSHHVRVAPHHSAALGIAFAAGLHVAAASPNLAAFEFQPALLPTINSILRVPMVVDGSGAFAVPDGPGLGVDVDEEQVRRFARSRAHG
jgi:L-alanine-DL-glutamate epimerase-like enolase superfamily enzyme